MKFCVMLQNTEIVDVINNVIKTGHIFKMALAIEQCRYVVKLYYESYSPVTVIRSMQNTIFRIKNLIICKYTLLPHR